MLSPFEFNNLVKSLLPTIKKEAKCSKCCENFGVTALSPPVAAPGVGDSDVLVNTTTGVIYYWNGTGWKTFTDQSLDIKNSVRVASTANIDIATALINGSTIDGVVVATGDRVLLKNQTAGAENGIYVVVASGAASRSEDANTSAKVTAGMYTFISEGAVNADTGYVLVTNDSITLGTTPLVFTQFTSIIAGANTALSNLAAVAINTSLLPGVDDTIDLGDNTHRWRDIYLGPATIHIGTSTADEGTLSYAAGGMSIRGGVAANNDLTLEGTSHATKTSSYVLLQPSGGNVIVGANVTNGSATPVNVSFGGTYGTNTPGSTGNLKWDMYNAGGVRYGIGMSAFMMEYQVENNASHAFFVNSIEKARLNTTGLGIGTTSPDRLLHAESATALTNTVSYAQRLSHITSGVAAVNFGLGQEYELENASGTNRVAATHEVTWSDATDATEDATYKLRLIRAGTLTDVVTVSSIGGLSATTLNTPATLLTLGVGATTFAVTSNVMTITADGAGNTIATITGGVSGQILTLIFANALTSITDDATGTANTVNLSAAFTSTAGDVLTLVFDSVSWYEVGRSIN